MASANSTLYAKQVGSAGSSPSASYPLAKSAAGKIRIAEIETTVGAMGAANDTFNLVRLKPGARVLPAQCRILAENPGTTFTFKVGDAGDDDRYLTAYAAGGGAKDVGFGAAPGVAAYVGYTIERVNEDVVATITAAASTTAASKVKIIIAYLDE
jgi:hypothetical protein